MTTFRVHYEFIWNGERGSTVVSAKSSEEAANIVRGRLASEGRVVIRKVKVDRS